MRRRFLHFAAGALAALAALATIQGETARAAITHRYSFTTDASDSVGTAHGTLFGTNGSFTGGQLVLANTGEGSQNPGTAGAYLDLPNGIVTSAATTGTNGALTVEMWITMSQHRDWAAAFSAGTSINGEDTSDCCNGDQPYIQIIPRTGDGGQGNDFRVTSNSYGGDEGFVDDLAAGNGADLALGRKEHVVAVFDQSASPGPGLPGQVTVYRNGNVMGTATMAANLNLSTFFRADNTGGDVNIWVGRSQWPDSLMAGSVDELRIYDTVVSQQQALINTVFGPNVVGATAIPSIEVNKSTGAITLKNNASVPLSLEYYSITSAGMAMNVAGWNSLDQQNYNAVDGTDGGTTPGDSVGEGWDKAGGSDAKQLIELFLRSSGSTLAANASLNLGNAYNTSTFGAADGDLQFKFGVAGGSLISGPVTYVGSVGDADFNNVNGVDGGDVLIWQRNLGLAAGASNAQGDANGDGAVNSADLGVWVSTFGAGAAVGAAGAVPEPSAALLTLVSLASLSAAGRRTSRRIG